MAEEQGETSAPPARNRVRIILYSLLVILLLLFLTVAAQERAVERRMGEGHAMPAFPSADQPGIVHYQTGK